MCVQCTGNCIHFRLRNGYSCEIVDVWETWNVSIGGEGLELPTFGLMPNALTIWVIELVQIAVKNIQTRAQQTCSLLVVSVEDSRFIELATIKIIVTTFQVLVAYIGPVYMWGPHLGMAFSADTSAHLGARPSTDTMVNIRTSGLPTFTGYQCLRIFCLLNGAIKITATIARHSQCLIPHAWCDWIQ